MKVKYSNFSFICFLFCLLFYIQDAHSYQKTIKIDLFYTYADSKEKRIGKTEIKFEGDGTGESKATLLDKNDNGEKIETDFPIVEFFADKTLLGTFQGINCYSVKEKIRLMMSAEELINIAKACIRRDNFKKLIKDEEFQEIYSKTIEAAFDLIDGNITFKTYKYNTCGDHPSDSRNTENDVFSKILLSESTSLRLHFKLK